MCKTFILVTLEAEKLSAKHLPVYFETPCILMRVPIEKEPENLDILDLGKRSHSRKNPLDFRNGREKIKS